MKDEGGPAFPVVIAKTQEQFAPGMTLRDWFAGQALQGYLASADPGLEMTLDSIADDCFRIADEMLARREKDRDE